MRLELLNPDEVWGGISRELGDTAQKIPNNAIIAGGGVANLVLRGTTYKEGPIRDIDAFIPRNPQTTQHSHSVGDYFSEVAIEATHGKLQILGLSGLANSREPTIAVIRYFDLNCCQISINREERSAEKDKHAVKLRTGVNLAYSRQFEQFTKDKLLKITDGGTPLRTLARFWKKVEDLGLDQTKEQQDNNEDEMYLLNNVLRSHLSFDPSAGTLNQNESTKAIRELLEKHRAKFEPYFDIGETNGSITVTPKPHQRVTPACRTNTNIEAARTALNNWNKKDHPDACLKYPDHLSNCRNLNEDQFYQLLKNNHIISKNLFDRFLQQLGPSQVWQVVAYADTNSNSIPEEYRNNLPLDHVLEERKGQDLQNNGATLLEALCSNGNLGLIQSTQPVDWAKNPLKRWLQTISDPTNNGGVETMRHFKTVAQLLPQGTNLSQMPEAVLAALTLEGLKHVAVNPEWLTKQTLELPHIIEQLRRGTIDGSINSLYRIPANVLVEVYPTLKKHIEQHINEAELESEEYEDDKADKENNNLKEWLVYAAKQIIQQKSQHLRKQVR